MKNEIRFPWQLISIVVGLASLFVVNTTAQSVDKTENTVRFMTYNTHNAIGMDRVTDYQRLAQVIIQATPDVVALQELDSVSQRSKGVDVLSRLADFTKMHAVYGASIPFEGGKYGIGVLSKEKPLSWKRIPLPGREEARSLLIVEFSQYVFCCTHFSLKEEDRLTSVGIINQAVAGFKKPVFLAGDMNALPESPVMKNLTEQWTYLSNPKQPTSPSQTPQNTIDYILLHKKDGFLGSVLKAKVIHEPVASDHEPLYVDFRFKAPKSAIFRTTPYLQNLKPDAVTVMWMTSVPCYSWVEVGTDSLKMQRVRTYVEGETVANNTLNRIRLDGLKPGTRYYYRICSREITLYQPYKKEFGETAVSKAYSFSTFNNVQKDFTALIFNDIHDNYPLFDQLYEQVKNVPYDIVFFNGDCIADVQTEENAIRSISHYSGKIGAEQVPSIYLRGNHETRGAYSPFLWNLLERVDGHSYAAFNIGDTRFVLLDAGEDKPDTTAVYYDLNDFSQYRKDQAGFLKKELVSLPFKNASKHVLIYHIPTYGMNKDYYRPGYNEWEKILSTANFNICLNGHVHRFGYWPKGKDGNNFPVVTGGGNNDQSGTVMILRKKGNKMDLQVLNTKGESLLKLDL